MQTDLVIWIATDHITADGAGGHGTGIARRTDIHIVMDAGITGADECTRGPSCASSFYFIRFGDA